MFRYVLAFIFAVSLASAATISTSAGCDGVTTTGTFSASCNDADITGFASASAMVQTGVTIGISVQTAVQSLMNPRSASASANISGDYVFTVFGGTGGGFFYPCFVGSFASHSGALGGGSFGGVGFQFTGSSSFPASNCRVFGSLSDFFPLSEPFTFGVPQIVPLSMGVLVSSPGALVQDSAGESFPGGNFGFPAFFFFDPAGNPLSNITFTLVEVPEPSAWSLLGIGLMFFGALAMIFHGVTNDEVTSGEPVLNRGRIAPTQSKSQAKWKRRWYKNTKRDQNRIIDTDFHPHSTRLPRSKPLECSLTPPLSTWSS